MSCRTFAVIVEPDRSQLIELARLVDDGRLRVEVAGAFALEEFAEAYAFASTGRRRGKVVMEVVPAEAASPRVLAASTADENNQ